LLIGYETGQIVLWDLRTRTAEMRCQCTEPLKSISWHHEGKQFMCSHTDGSLTTWAVRQAPKPINVSQPHGKCICVWLFSFVTVQAYTPVIQLYAAFFQTL